MKIDDLFKYREDLLNDSRDDDGFILSQFILSQILPSMMESKLIDSDDYDECYHYIDKAKVSINGYAINESNERLQIYVLDKRTADETMSISDLHISEKQVYEKILRNVSRFIRACINGDMNNKVQDSSTAKLLVNMLNSSEVIEQIDVIEIFLISLTATVSFKGEDVAARSMYLKDETLPVKWLKEGSELKKDMLIQKKIIDLNFLYTVQLSEGKGTPLEVRFSDFYDSGISAMKVATENKFESFLCVLPAVFLAELYKRYSSRLLEKNVRSFLQFRGVNSGIKKTIDEEPEKFIAYNNGLTITASDIKLASRKGQLQILSLTDFQIVNGGQTTATIFFSKKEGLDISKVKVMAKINVVRNNNETDLDSLISSISQFSNAQSRVSNVDLNARNQELIDIKKLSDNIITPTGKRWFFERAKGEYQTLLRLARRKNKLAEEYPVSRRFSKELLAKYYSAWGDEPFKVKKGGEKIFRHFIEKISRNDSKSIKIDRDFYEKTISKIMMFRGMEKIYGQGKNAIGQLRSAVIPYSLSILYLYTDSTKEKSFDMARIWKTEGLDRNQEVFLRELMLLMNSLIKKYSTSDDYGENSKKEALWDKIKDSVEILRFMSTGMSKEFLDKYTEINSTCDANEVV